MREVFNEAGKPKDTERLDSQDFAALEEALERALFTFESTSNHAVVRLYRRGLGSPSMSRLSESFQSSDENSMLMGAESESIFLVYL